MADISSASYLILVRHSNVQIDQERSSHEWLLSENGRVRCVTFAERLLPYGPDLFISSQEPKAAETGQLMSRVLGIPNQVASGLQEHNRSAGPYFGTQAAFRDAIKELFASPETQSFGQETGIEALARFNHAIARCLNLYPAQNLAIVTHGTVMTLFVCHHNAQLDPVTLWSDLTMPCAVILNRPDSSLNAILLTKQHSNSV